MAITGTERRYQKMKVLAEEFSVNGKALALNGAAIVSLTNANGTGDNTIADVTATPTQTLVNNNFRDCSDKINAILAALRTAGIIAP
jgi:hypothetical protein